MTFKNLLPHLPDLSWRLLCCCNGSSRTERCTWSVWTALFAARWTACCGFSNP